MMRYVVIFILLFTAITINAQVKYTYSGTVKDSLTGEALIGAYVFFPQIKAGCATNAYGFFSITLPSGKYTVKFNYLGIPQKQ